MEELVRIYCGCCGRIFDVCRRCYRGQRYCSEECRKAGYRESRKEAQKRYRQTSAGRKNHRIAEKNAD